MLLDVLLVDGMADCGDEEEDEVLEAEKKERRRMRGEEGWDPVDVEWVREGILLMGRLGRRKR